MFKTAKSRREVLKFNRFGFRLSFQKIKISMRHATLFAIALLFTTHFAAACSKSTTIMPTTITYPETRQVDVVEERFGQAIADRYRWLENDVRNDQEVAVWVESQNKITNAHLNTLPGREIFRDRLKQLYNLSGLPFRSKRGDGISTSIILDFRTNEFSMSATA